MIYPVHRTLMFRENLALKKAVFAGIHLWNLSSSNNPHLFYFKVFIWCGQKMWYIRGIVRSMIRATFSALFLAFWGIKWFCRLNSSKLINIFPYFSPSSITLGLKDVIWVPLAIESIYVNVIYTRWFRTITQKFRPAKQNQVVMA